MKVTAKATRAGDWWAIEIADVPGGPFHTQTRRLDQVEALVKDGVALNAPHGSRAKPLRSCAWKG
jgi:hypothetical protein